MSDTNYPEERMYQRGEEEGFWACFYCANTHQVGQDCKCICHKDEPNSHAEQNKKWLNRIQGKPYSP
jgi:hypothetical protein